MNMSSFRACFLRLGVLFGLLLSVSFVGSSAHAQETRDRESIIRQIDPTTVRPIDPSLLPPIAETCGLTAKPFEGTSVTESPRSSDKAAKQSATFIVDYGPGFQQNPAAVAAFERAVATWETHIQSDVPIRIDASFADLGVGVLGGARGAYVVGDLNGQDVVVAINLLEAANGQALETLNPSSGRSSEDPEIIAQFNSDRNDWNFDEGPAASNEIDFETVVLHEIGHGLQFASTFEYNGSSGDNDCNGQTGTACYGFGTGFPSTFDQEVVLFQSTTGDEQLLIDLPNPSAELADAVQTSAIEFQTEQVRFSGPNASVNGAIDNGPQPPILYFPASWRDGSSGSHVDESTYPPSSADALMSPEFGFGETTRLPGPVVCGMLDDMGWPLGVNCLQYARDPAAFRLADRDVVGGGATLSWLVTEAVEVSSYTVQRQFFDGPFEPVATLDGSTDPSFTDTGLGLGEYTYRLDFTRPDGSTGTVSDRPTVTIDIVDVEVTVQAGDPDSPQSDMLVEWQVPPATSGFTYIVERRRGSSVRDNPFEEAGRTTTSQFVDENLFPGVYAYRIRALSAGQNEVRSTTSEAEITSEDDVFISGPNPNPVAQGLSQAELTITSQTQQEATVSVYNTIGQLVYNTDLQLRQNAATPINIPTSELASGMYFIQVRAEEFTTTRRMVVAR